MFTINILRSFSFLFLVFLFSSELYAESICTSHVFLKEGQQAIKQNQFVVAIRTCQKGLTLLADNYASDGFIDDTGSKLIAINMEYKKRHFKNAAQGYCQVLASRWHMLLSAKKCANIMEPL